MSTDAKNRLLGLMLLARRLHDTGGPEEDLEGFEEYGAEQENLLKAFGLPPASEYLALVDFSDLAVLSVDHLDVLMDSLASKGHEYAEERARKTDLDLLREGLARGKDPFDVLPRIGITTHIYPLFLYALVDTHDEAGLRRILTEMKEAEPLLNAIGILDASKPGGDRNTYGFLKRHHLSHLDAFLAREED